MPLPWPGRVPVLGVLRRVWQPGWLGTAFPRPEVPSPCSPFFTAGAVAMPTPAGQPSAALGSSRGVDGRRLEAGAATGPVLAAGSRREAAITHAGQEQLFPLLLSMKK